MCYLTEKGLIKYVLRFESNLSYIAMASNGVVNPKQNIHPKKKQTNKREPSPRPNFF